MQLSKKTLSILLIVIIIIAALLVGTPLISRVGYVILITAHVLAENQSPTIPILTAEPNQEGATSIDLQWLASTDDENNSIKYFIRMGTTSDGTNTLNSSTFDTNYNNVSVSAANTYYWSVKACDNSSGNWGNCSNWSSQDSFAITAPPSEDEGGQATEEAAPLTEEAASPVETVTEAQEAITDAETAMEEGSAEEATDLLGIAIESAQTLIAEGNIGEAETVLTAVQPIQEQLINSTTATALELYEGTEDIAEALGLDELGLTEEEMLTAQQNQEEIKTLLIQAQAETDESAKKELLSQVQQLQRESLEAMPEIEKVAETSDAVKTTSYNLQKASEQATAPEALTLLGKIVASESKAPTKVVIERTLTAYKITNKEQTNAIAIRTRVELKFEALEDMENVVVVETIPKKALFSEAIPKNLASNASQLIFLGQQPTILQTDPTVIVSWRFDKVRKGEAKTVSYIVKKKMEKMESITLMGKNIFIEEKPLFDVSVSVIAESKQVLAGESVIAEIQLTKMRGAKVDVDVHYSIKDLEGNIIATKHEMVAVETKAIFVVRLAVPPGLKAGKYTFHVKVEHGEEVWKASDSFEVAQIVETATIALAAIISALILLAFLLYKKTKKWTKSKKTVLADILKELNNTRNVTGSAIATRDGLVIASQLPKDINSATFAAMSAAMTSAAQTAISRLAKDRIERVIVESKKTKIISIEAGPKAILVAMASGKAKLGLILIEMKKAAEKIEKTRNLGTLFALKSTWKKKPKTKRKKHK